MMYRTEPSNKIYLAKWARGYAHVVERNLLTGEFWLKVIRLCNKSALPSSGFVFPYESMMKLCDKASDNYALGCKAEDDSGNNIPYPYIPDPEMSPIH